MDAFTTYEFYTNTYYGEDIQTSSFPKWLSKATDKLNYLTFGNITEELLALYATQISKATCALMDVMYKLDYAAKNVSNAETGNIKSMSSGGESVTFNSTDTEITKALSDVSAQNSLMRDTISEYLSGTGLLYAGVEPKVPDVL